MRTGCKKWVKWGSIGFVALVIYTAVGMAVGWIPTPEESYATETAEALAEVVELPTRFILPTDTPTTILTLPPVETPTQMPTATINRPTLPPSYTPTSSPIPLPTRTPSPITMYAISNANVRSCPQLDCAIVGSLAWGHSIEVIDQVDGVSVSGSSLWYKFDQNGEACFVHSSLVARSRPATAKPVYVPANPVYATAAPQPASPAYTCDCSKTCGAMASCEEAYFQLNTCGCSSRDSDSDGVPCESICPGG